MRIIHLILGGLIFLAIIVVYIAQQPPTGEAIGYAQSNYPGMMAGGEGAERSAPLFLPILLWQFCVIGLGIAFIIQATPVHNRTIGFYGAMFVSGLAMAASWAALMLSYKNYLISGETAYIFGFPLATSWLVYGIWLSEAFLALFYVIGFRRYVFTEENERAFAQLLAEKKSAPSQEERL
ncbi:MAG: hypothetical protein ACWA5L_00200 [bacterium]